jgi:hypothetical protein
MKQPTQGQPEQPDDREDERLIGEIEAPLSVDSRARVWSRIEAQAAVQAQPAKTRSAMARKTLKREGRMTQTAAARRVAPAQDRFWSNAAAAAVMTVVVAGLFWLVSQRGTVAPTQSNGVPPPERPAVAVDGRGSVDPNDPKDPNDPQPKPAPAPVPVPAPAPEPRVEPEWEKEIKSKLSRKVTFEFVDMSLEDAVGFLRSLVNVTMIVDPQLFTDPQPIITLRATDLTLEIALKQICDEAKTEMHYVDQAVFISAQGKYRPKLPEIRKLTASEITTVEAAITQLGHDDFAVRDKATQQILAIGRGAVELVNAGIIKNKDAEVVNRLKAIADEFAYVPLNFDEPADVKAMLDTLTRKVTFEFVDTTVDDVIGFIRSLEKVNIGIDGAAEMKNINLRVTDMEVGTALRWIARLAGARMEYKDERLKLIANKSAKPEEKKPKPKER